MFLYSSRASRHWNNTVEGEDAYCIDINTDFRNGYKTRTDAVSYTHLLSDEQAKEIQKYYEQCAAQGSTNEQIEESQRAMSKMTAILGHPDRLKKLAADIVSHYEALCSEKPEIVQKAMIVCADRPLAFKVLKEILAIRPEWGEAKKAEDESQLTKEELDKLMALPKVNIDVYKRQLLLSGI